MKYDPLMLLEIYWPVCYFIQSIKCK